MFAVVIMSIKDPAGERFIITRQTQEKNIA